MNLVEVVLAFQSSLILIENLWVDGMPKLLRFVEVFVKTKQETRQELVDVLLLVRPELCESVAKDRLKVVNRFI